MDTEKKTMDTEKDKALDIAMAQIEKQFGRGSLMKLGEVSSKLTIASIPTGSLSLDLALGVGGVPRGRVIDIFGTESSGKSTLAQHIIAEAQKLGGKAAYIDAEHALDPSYAAKCGVDIQELYISQPDFAEQALEITEALVRSGAIDVVVIDSVAALVPRAELEGDMGDPQMGLQARLMSQALRKLTASINRSKTCVVFINQLREKVGVVFGNPETTPGGKALKFYSSVRIDLRRLETIKRGPGRHRQPGARQGGEEQGGAAVPRRRVRHHVRPRHQQRGRHHRLGREARDSAEERRALHLR